jgi:plastocyanin
MTRSKTRVWVALAIGGVLLVALGPGLAIAKEGLVSIVEKNDKYAYQPPDVTVALGTTVTWTNNSDAAHTVTADDSSFDSDTVAENATFSQTFDTPGKVPYHCTVHSYMHGTVTVLAAGQTPPATDAAARNGATTTPSSIPWFALLAGLLALIVLSGWVALPRREEKS